MGQKRGYAHRTRHDVHYIHSPGKSGGVERYPSTPTRGWHDDLPAEDVLDITVGAGWTSP